MSDRPAYPVSSYMSGVPSFHSDWWVCMPEPLSPNSGLGMNVTVLPFCHAVCLTMYLYSCMSSAACSSVLNL